jgi:hypothetical protein
MAHILITLDSDRQPYYVDQFGTPARPGDTLQWKSVKGRFSITIRDAFKFFSARTNPLTPPAFSNVEKIVVDSAGPVLSETYTIKSDLLTDAYKDYEVYCYSREDQGDAPPRIIITPLV